jgi:hypothetical protein
MPAFPAQAHVAAWGAGARRARRGRGPHPRLGRLVCRGPSEFFYFLMFFPNPTQWAGLGQNKRLHPPLLAHLNQCRFYFSEICFSISIFMCLKLVKSLSKLIIFLVTILEMFLELRISLVYPRFSAAQ